jgi:hypothetical protein
MILRDVITFPPPMPRRKALSTNVDVTGDQGISDGIDINALVL